jgi:hypothetical protein
MIGSWELDICDALNSNWRRWSRVIYPGMAWSLSWRWTVGTLPVPTACQLIDEHQFNGGNTRLLLIS